MVGHDQGATGAGNVLDAANLDAEPRLVQRSQQRKVGVLGEVLVEAVVVNCVVPAEASTNERQRRGNLTFDVVTGEPGCRSRPPQGGDREVDQFFDACSHANSSPRWLRRLSGGPP